MKCIECGSTMTTKRENVPFRALPGIVLEGVEVSRCSECGAYEVHIPALNELMRVLADWLIRRPGRLTGSEVRFLRKHLGYSGVDFAKRIHSAPATVSKWETGAQPIGPHSDLLLRAMVALDTKIDEYTSEEFVGVVEDQPKANPKKPHAFTLSASKKWKPVELRA